MTCNEAMNLKYQGVANGETILFHLIGLQTVSMLRNTEFKCSVIVMLNLPDMILEHLLEIRHSKLRYSIYVLLNCTLI